MSSWLNLNDSLNSLKGQLTNFATNVLADENSDPGINAELHELKAICAKQKEEIEQLRTLAERNLKQQAEQSEGNKVNNDNENWTWDTPDNDVNIIADLNTTIEKLKNEKRDLEKNLELLDIENQQNTSKILHLKNQLQDDYNDLEEKFNDLQDEYSKLKETNKRQEIKIKQLTDELQQLTSNDNNNNKFQELLKQNQKLENDVEEFKNEMILLSSQNTTLSEILDDLKTTSLNETKDLEEKLKLSESENKILIGELQKLKDYEKKSEIDDENYKKLGLILEGYEEQVSVLKKQLHNNNTELHNKYITIISDAVKRYNDCQKLSDFKHSTDEGDEFLAEFRNQVENLLKILLECKFKCDTLETETYKLEQEKTDLLTEKNNEIEKLIQNSEILSQEVLTKTQTIKDYENECTELMKNNDLLITELESYKTNSGLQTISETNEDNMLLLENQLETANKRIEELEKSLSPIPLEEKELESLRKEIYSLEEDKETLVEEKEELNTIVEKMRSDLENTEYQYSEININMEMLREEVENQTKKVEELIEQNQKLLELNTEFEHNNENIRAEVNSFKEKLLFEEDAKRQLEVQVRNLNEKLQNAKVSETSLKLQYDTVNKELHLLAENKNNLEGNLSETLKNLQISEEKRRKVEEELENYKILKKENEKLKLKEYQLEKELFDTKVLCEELQKNTEDMKDDESQLQNLRVEFEKLKNKDEINKLQIVQLTSEIEDLRLKNTQLESSKNETKRIEENEKLLEKISNLEKQIEELSASKNQLTAIIIQKQEENVTYYNEIQRLSQILQEQFEKIQNFEKVINNEEMLKKNEEYLKKTEEIVEKDEEILKKSNEIEKLVDQNNFLKEKCDILTESLLQEQNKVKQCLEEQPLKEQQLNKNLERLQAHLIEMEEHYTQELIKTQGRNEDLQMRLNELEQREKNSSTMYTSASIRANQHVETLQNQVQLITNQRDELRKRISDAEDYANKQGAALANLQFVLEKVQKEKERSVEIETDRIRKQIKVEKQVQEELRDEIKNLQLQLNESKQGLQAAGRLGDQLEYSKQLNNTLKGEVQQLTEKLERSEKKLKDLYSQTDGKVDKSLIKNLIVGFVSSNSNLTKDQTQILKIISTVLDFNEQDHDKVKGRSQGGWGLSSFLSPHSSQIHTDESLSQAFVKFLENESKPRVVPSLLSNNDETSSGTSARQSPIVLSEICLPTFNDFAQNRNSSSILKDVLKDNTNNN